MTDNDAFFTHTIVGAPFSVLLGRRRSGQDAAAAGIEVDLAGAEVRLGTPWQDAFILGRAADTRGRPRRRPGTALRWLERHALLVAAAGLAALACSGVVLLIGLKPWI
jgi:hypothetical protein